MAKEKKKVVVYTDWLSTFEALSNEEAGLLIKHFFRYVNDLNPEYPDRTTELLFIPIMQTLKRDLKKWEDTCEKNRQNVRKRWDKKDTTVNDRKRPHTKNTDSDNDSDIKEYPILRTWVEYRKQLKKPLTPHGITTLLNKIKTKPLAEVEWVINNSMENGWQGLFWEQYKGSELPPIPKQVASIALQGSQDTLNSLLSKGYTMEQIKQAVK